MEKLDRITVNRSMGDAEGTSLMEEMRSVIRGKIKVLNAS